MVTKQTIVEEIANETEGYAKKDIDTVVSMVFEKLANHIKNKEEVSIYGLMTVRYSNVAARVNTLQSVDKVIPKLIPAHTKILIRPSGVLKDAVK